MRGRVFIAVAAACLLVAATAVDPASAQTRDDSYEWSAFAGQTIFDSDLDLRDAFYFGTRFGINFTEHHELELGIGFADSRKETSPFQGDTDVMDLAAAWVWNFPGQKDNTWRWVPYVTAGLGISSFDFQDLRGEQDTALHVGGGFRWFGTNKVGLRVEAKGIGETTGDWTNFALTAGLSFVSGGELRDMDGDTVPDGRDDCPNTPMGCAVDLRGCSTDGDDDGVCDGLDQCPETRVACMVNAQGCDLDSDGDGVCDGIDQCPDTPDGCRVDGRGCSSDSDGDGVCDGVDRCAGTRSGCRVDASGCDLDGDRDGVCDGVDRCPDTRSGCRVDPNGCALDEDGDGVCDGIDRCPGTPRGTDVDANGCELELRISNVQFDLDKANIKPEFEPILRDVAKALRDNPDMRILLAGHTDSINTEEYNLRLSRRRAQAVKDWLVKRGISAGRLEVEANGECCPIADNETREGRYRNRRVEFKRIN